MATASASCLTSASRAICDAMRDNAILQLAARIWGEPVVAFGDDAGGYFNQFHLHPPQLHLTTILW